MASVRLFPGKAEFLTYLDEFGIKRELCLCKYNVDFSEGCISHVLMENMELVFHNDWGYGDEFMKSHSYEELRSGCDYCYAKRKNFHKVTPKTIDHNTLKDLDNLRMDCGGIIRLGKNVEAGHPIYFSQLTDFLKLCAFYGDSVKGVIFPTKSLTFGREGLEKKLLDLLDEKGIIIPSGEELSLLLGRANAVVNYSIGYDKLERGPVSQGFTNKWRLEQAKKFYEHGVNVTATITCDVTSSIEDNIRNGSGIKYALEMGLIERVIDGSEVKYVLGKGKVPIRFLPLRPNNSYVAMESTGVKRSCLFGNYSNKQLPLIELGHTYLSRSNNELYPKMLHPDFAGLFDQDVGFCGEIKDEHHCDGCGLPGKERVKISNDKFIPVEKGIIEKRKNKKKEIEISEEEEQQINFEFRIREPKMKINLLKNS